MSEAVALVGDWNATPDDSGRWTPSWLAQATGLRVTSSGPGRHGDIDYVLADCHVSGATRLGPPSGPSRSDHDVIVFTLTRPGTEDEKLRVVTWNLEYGRPPRDVAAQVNHVIHQLHKPAVLALQEAGDYHAELRAVAEANGYRMLAYPGPGRRNQVLLARREFPARRPRCVQLSPFGWPLADGPGDHAPLFGTSWAVEWLRVVCVHMPPSVNWTRGVIHGPPRKVAAYAAGMGKLARWVRNNRRHRRP